MKNKYTSPEAIAIIMEEHDVLCQTSGNGEDGKEGVDGGEITKGEDGGDNIPGSQQRIWIFN